MDTAQGMEEGLPLLCVANQHSFQLSWLGGCGDQEAPQVGRAVSEAQELLCGFSELRGIASDTPQVGHTV